MKDLIHATSFIFSNPLSFIIILLLSIIQSILAAITLSLESVRESVLFSLLTFFLILVISVFIFGFFVQSTHNIVNSRSEIQRKRSLPSLSAAFFLIGVKRLFVLGILLLPLAILFSLSFLLLSDTSLSFALIFLIPFSFLFIYATTVSLLHWAVHKKITSAFAFKKILRKMFKLKAMLLFSSFFLLLISFSLVFSYILNITSDSSVRFVFIIAQPLYIFFWLIGIYILGKHL